MKAPDLAEAFKEANEFDLGTEQCVDARRLTRVHMKNQTFGCPWKRITSSFLVI